MTETPNYKLKIPDNTELLEFSWNILKDTITRIDELLKQNGGNVDTVKAEIELIIQQTKTELQNAMNDLGTNLANTLIVFNRIKDDIEGLDTVYRRIDDSYDRATSDARYASASNVLEIKQKIDRLLSDVASLLPPGIAILDDTAPKTDRTYSSKKVQDLLDELDAKYKKKINDGLSSGLASHIMFRGV